MKWNKVFPIGLSLVVIGGCMNVSSVKKEEPSAVKADITTTAPKEETLQAIPKNKNLGVFYEIFVRSFYDSNGDGIGDLRGVTAKLDYLKDLGVEGIWLMPIHPSPSYHGYDVSDYYQVNKQYGTLEDFRHLTDEAHKRGIKVIIDLVANHTSSQNPWFLESAKGKDNKYRSWYTWAEDTGKNLVEKSALGNMAWNEKNGSHYLGVFNGRMPDLNYDNLEVRKEMVNVGQFWLKQGSDGFRMDAAMYIYRDMESDKSKSESVIKNQAWWQEFHKGLNEVNPNAYVVGEVWDKPEVIAPLLNNALDSGFNFELAKQLLNAVNSENSNSIVEKVKQIYELYSTKSHGNYVDAPFLSNHDQVRVMSTLKGNLNHAKMAASVLMTLPGNPFLYYGEEIGMTGIKPDELLREPMAWYDGGKGKGQTSWESSLYKGSSVEAEAKDPDSLLNHYKKVILWRQKEPALRDGDFQSYPVTNHGIVAFVRETEKEKMLAIHNLTGKEQNIDIKKFAVIVLSSKEGGKLKDGKLTMAPFSSVILK